MSIPIVPYILRYALCYRGSRGRYQLTMSCLMESRLEEPVYEDHDEQLRESYQEIIASMKTRVR